MTSDRIRAAESGGDRFAKNPRSTATGPDQFIESTWLDMISRHRPDLIEGKARQELLSLRSDEVLSGQMTDAYSAENNARLEKAGLPVRPGTTYLSHFAGPDGARAVLTANPTASAASILGPAVLKANPFLANMSAGDLIAWADTKMGGAKRAAAPSGGLLAPASGQPMQIAPQQGLLAGLPQQAPSLNQAPPPGAAMNPMQPQQPAGPSLADGPMAAPMMRRRPPDLRALQAMIRQPGLGRQFSWS